MVIITEGREVTFGNVVSATQIIDVSVIDRSQSPETVRNDSVHLETGEIRVDAPEKCLSMDKVKRIAGLIERERRMVVSVSRDSYIHRSGIMDGRLS